MGMAGRDGPGREQLLPPVATLQSPAFALDWLTPLSQPGLDLTPALQPRHKRRQRHQALAAMRGRAARVARRRRHVPLRRCRPLASPPPL